MAIFNKGDIVQSRTHGYTGIVIGYHPELQNLVRVKRDDGRIGQYGEFWQTHENSFKLISTVSLINE